MVSPPTEITLHFKCTVFQDQKSTPGDLKLSVSDPPMLSCHYIQKGCLFTLPTSVSMESLFSNLKLAVSQAPSQSPPLAGRSKTDSDGYVYITCNDAGVDVFYANANYLNIRDIISPIHGPEEAKSFFPFDPTVSYDGHTKPIMSVLVTELADGVFIVCAVNHGVTDGTSFWNFFNTFAEMSRGMKKISKQPDFLRESILISPAMFRFPDGPPKVTFNEGEPLSERIFSFSREWILKLNSKVNTKTKLTDNGGTGVIELFGKQRNDKYHNNNDAKATTLLGNWFKNAVPKQQVVDVESNDVSKVEISSFQLLRVLLWRAVARARKMFGRVGLTYNGSNTGAQTPPPPPPSTTSSPDSGKEADNDKANLQILFPVNLGSVFAIIQVWTSNRDSLSSYDIILIYLIVCSAAAASFFSAHRLLRNPTAAPEWVSKAAITFTGWDIIGWMCILLPGVAKLVVASLLCFVIIFAI